MEEIIIEYACECAAEQERERVVAYLRTYAEKLSNHPGYALLPGVRGASAVLNDMAKHIEEGKHLP